MVRGFGNKVVGDFTWVMGHGQHTIACQNLQLCHCYSVSITQKHLKFVSSFHNSSLNLVKIEQ